MYIIMYNSVLKAVKNQKKPLTEGRRKIARQNRLTRIACAKRILEATPARLVRVKQEGKNPDVAACSNPLAGEISQFTIVPIEPMAMASAIIGVSTARPKTEKTSLNACSNPATRLI